MITHIYIYILYILYAESALRHQTDPGTGPNHKWHHQLKFGAFRYNHVKVSLM